ncbi:hypothetical protein CDV55_105767 [Aspergillus turcosus]|nr:hypothetical protein CDV55_105767 [Aspergillus turcosus]
MNQDDYREEVQKKTSGLRLGSSKDEVRDVWQQVVEYLFPKQTADCPREGFVHKYFNYESEFPHIGIVNPRGDHSYLPVFHVYCQSLPTAEAENVVPGARTPWRALEDAVKYELTGIMSLIKECRPNLNAIIVAGPLVRFCGVNKKGEFWDLGFDAEEGAWNIHDDFDAILEGLVMIRSKIDPACFVPFGASRVIKEEPVEGR